MRVCPIMSYNWCDLPVTLLYVQKKKLTNKQKKIILVRLKFEITVSANSIFVTCNRILVL